MNYPFWLPGFYPTSVIGTPTNSQLEQMLTESKPASSVGVTVYSDTAPDCVTYPDLVNATWHQTIGGTKTGYLYYYNGTAWTPMKQQPGSLTGDSFPDQSIGIEKLEPGTAYYVPQTNAGATAVVWVTADSLFGPNTFGLGKLSYATAPDYFMVSGASNDWGGVAPLVAANKIATAAKTAALVAVASATNDGVMFFQASDNTAHTLAFGRFYEILVDLASAETVTAATNKILVYKDTAAAGSKGVQVTLDKLLPPQAGFTAGTYNGLTINQQGLVTGISTSANITIATLVDTQSPGVAPQALTPTVIATARLTVETAQSWLTLTSNEFQLSPGVYLITAIVPMYYAGGVAASYVSLYNVTAGSRVASVNAKVTVDGDFTTATLIQPVVVTAATKYSIQAYSTQAATLGYVNNIAGVNEVYQRVVIQKLA